MVLYLKQYMNLMIYVLKNSFANSVYITLVHQMKMSAVLNEVLETLFYLKVIHKLP